jgi:hypothetical protein
MIPAITCSRVWSWASQKSDRPFPFSAPRLTSGCGGLTRHNSDSVDAMISPYAILADMRDGRRDGSPSGDAHAAVVLHSPLSKPFCYAWLSDARAPVTSQDESNSVTLFSPCTCSGLYGW